MNCNINLEDDSIKSKKELILYENQYIDITSFFTTLWGNTPPNGYIVLWTKNNKQANFFLLSQIEIIAKRAIDLNKSDALYFAVGMQKEQLHNQRGSKEKVIAIPGFWVDIDIMHPIAHKQQDLIPSIEVAEHFIAQLPLQPSIIVNSGYGFHCHWIFEKPWVFESDSDRQKAAALSNIFQKSIIDEAKKNNWHIDNTYSLAQLLRIPGTTNNKLLDQPVPVTIHSQNSNRYTPDDFKAFSINKYISIPSPDVNTVLSLPKKVKDVQIQIAPEPPQDSDSRNSQIIHELINRCAFLRHCKENAASLSEPDWHKMICILAHEYGGSEVIHEISKPYPKYTKKETDQYILKALQRSNSPITCDNLKQSAINWNCNKDCSVNSPIHLKQEILSNFGITQAKTAVKDSHEEENYGDIDLLKERIPDVAFPWDSFPLYLSETFKDLSMDMGVQPEMCAVVGLGVLSTAIGSLVKHVSVKKGYKSPVNLWIAIIAGTGEKKTPVLSRLMQPIHKKQKELVNEYKKLHREWEQRQKQKQNQKATNDDPEPKQVSLYTTDPTIEALVRLLNDNPHGILLYQDEISGLLLGFDKYRGGKGGDREQYLSFWNALPIKIDRVKESFYVADPYLSLLGGLQPQKAVRLFGEDSFDDGLISRFLFYLKPDIYQNVSLHEWNNDYEANWTLLIQTCYSMTCKNKLELTFDNATKQVFIDYENSLTALIPYVPKRFAIFIPKATNYVLRISGILHIIESIWQGQKVIPTVISVDTLNRAINLVNFFLSQARKIVELYSPKKVSLSMDYKHVLVSIISVHETRNSFELPTGDIISVYNNNVPKEAKIESDVSFGKLLVKIMKEFNINYEKKRKLIDGKNYQCCIINAKSLEQIKKILNS